MPFVSNQPQYNMLWRVIEAEVVPTCRELGIGQIVWSPIAQGVLTGKYKPGEDYPAGSRATDDKGGADMVARYLTDDVLERVQQLQPLADEAGLSLAQLAIAWTLQNDNVSAAIIGASRPEQVTENVKAAGVRLDADLLKQIDEMLDPVVERDPAKTQSPPRRGQRPDADERLSPARAARVRARAGAGSSGRRPRGSPSSSTTSVDPGLEQVGPQLAEPALGVGLGRERRRRGRRC